MCPQNEENMAMSMEQCYAMRFFVCLNKMKKEMIVLVQEAFGDDILHESSLQRWYRAFESGWVVAELQPHGRKPKMVIFEPEVRFCRDRLHTLHISRSSVKIYQIEEIWC